MFERRWYMILQLAKVFSLVYFVFMVLLSMIHRNFAVDKNNV